MHKVISDPIIKFETAKLAKEKGLIEGLAVDGAYDVGWGETHISKTRSLLVIMQNGGIWKRNTVKGQLHLALAPSQSLLQKWLRSKGFWVNVWWDHLTHYYYCDVCLWNDRKRVVNKSSKNKKMLEFENYEDALEAGLFKALKLINA